MRHFLLAAVVAAGLAIPGAASACDGGFGYGGYGIGLLYNSLDFRVPYFAAHPPVYYSYPVPRTYGHSPFAYPPHFRTPEIVEEAPPLTVTNPYFPSSATEPAPEADETVKAEPRTNAPLVINNPYVQQGPPVRTAAF